MGTGGQREWYKGACGHSRILLHPKRRHGVRKEAQLPKHNVRLPLPRLCGGGRRGAAGRALARAAARRVGVRPPAPPHAAAQLRQLHAPASYTAASQNWVLEKRGCARTRAWR